LEVRRYIHRNHLKAGITETLADSSAVQRIKTLLQDDSAAAKAARNNQEASSQKSKAALTPFLGWKFDLGSGSLWHLNRSVFSLIFFLAANKV